MVTVKYPPSKYKYNFSIYILQMLFLVLHNKYLFAFSFRNIILTFHVLFNVDFIFRVINFTAQIETGSRHSRRPKSESTNKEQTQKSCEYVGITEIIHRQRINTKVLRIRGHYKNNQPTKNKH